MNRVASHKIVLPMIHLDQIIFTPLPQLRLKNALVARGHDPNDIIVTEYRRDDSLQAILDDILAYKPDIVGFSCYTWNFLAVERLSQALRSLGKTIVWGGPHVSECPDRFLQRYSDSVDIVITWYGEGSFPSYINKPENEKIPGIFRLQNNEVIGTKAIDYPHIAELGYPYEYMPMSVTRNISERVFLIESYRNCSFSCAYCLWGQAAKHYDHLSSEVMIEQMYRMVDDGARIFMYADAGLGLIREDKGQRDLKVFSKFVADGYLQKKNAQIRGYFFWQCLNDEILDVIAELIDQRVMGQLDIGIQTFNKAVLEDLQRPTNYDKFYEVIERLHQRNIRFSLDLILGLPGDTLEGYKYSLRKVIECRPDRTQTFPLSILPGTSYDLNRERLEIKAIRGSYRDDAETVISTKTMPYEDMLTCLDYESWMFLYYAEGLFKDGLNAIAKEQGKDELDVLKSLWDWAETNNTALYELAKVYREKLYDSRSDGRHLLEEKLVEDFPTIYKELLWWAEYQWASTKAKDLLRNELLTFPKTIKAAKGLDNIDGIVYKDGTLTRNGITYVWRCDPVIGAIVRNKNFYTWLSTDTIATYVDKSTSDDLLQGTKL